MSLHLKESFTADPQRFEHFSQSVSVGEHSIFCDLSKNLIDRKIEFTLIARAARAGLEAKRDAMFKGETINNTEGRAVGHVRLRNPSDTEARPIVDAFLAYADAIRADDAITDIVNIGIGGSDLGPAFAVRALDQFANHKKRYHFVSNVDGHELNAVLRQIKPASTLFIIASKTFTTAETMLNAATARAWFIANGGTVDGSSSLDTATHFCAVTTNVPAAKEFGINTTFGFWDWVGGRYSLWSAIGLSLAIAIGGKGFRAFLSGAHAMDTHFKTAPLAQNLPVRLGLLDVYYRNDLKLSSRCIAPYSSALGRLPAYLQQLEMESNGKSVDVNGKPLGTSTSPVQTSPVIWGEAGTNGQHAFFQMLHQGTDVIPVEFVAVKTPTYDAGTNHPMDTASQALHHKALLANVIAQAQALMQGKADAGGHKNFSGNRPSTFILLDALTPETLGGLIALYEHRVFVSGVLWGINSFDQFGVELGKVLAKDIEPRLASGDGMGLDTSTAGLLKKLS